MKSEQSSVAVAQLVLVRLFHCMNTSFDAQTLLIALVTGIIGPCILAFLNHSLELRRTSTVAKSQKDEMGPGKAAIYVLSVYLVFATGYQLFGTYGYIHLVLTSTSPSDNVSYLVWALLIIAV